MFLLRRYFKEKPISDYPVYEMRWDIGYVLQQIALFPHMTIKENIAQVPQMKKWKDKDIHRRVDELLDMVRLDPNTYRDRKPDELSGGQRQRVGVVRALAADPPVILMDEPFSALDPISREKLQDDLLELQTKIKKTIIFVTHDIQEAMKLGDRICLLNDGRVEQIDTPEGFQEHPRNQFVREFMGDHLHKDINNSKISDLNLTRTLTEYDEKQGYPIIKDSMKLQDTYEILAKHEAVIVENNHALTQSLLRREDVIRRNDVRIRRALYSLTRSSLIMSQINGVRRRLHNGICSEIKFRSIFLLRDIVLEQEFVIKNIEDI